MKELDSEPEPDLMVCSNPDLAAYGTESMKPVLVVEVAESSLRYDLGDEATLYAKARIPEYWVVNLMDAALEVFREPRNEVYETRSTLNRSARVSPRARPDVERRVESLLA